jgi:serine/alanine adding enzyme
VIEETFGHRTLYLCADDGEKLVGILPLAQVKSRLFGNMLVSLPFFNYGGICSTSEEGRNALLGAAIHAARDRHADFLELRHDDDWEQGLTRKTSKVSMRLELPTEPGDLWRAFPSKLRNQIQKPRKENMTAAIGREEQLDGFYDVFSENMRDIGTPVYPKKFFRNILRKFPKQTWIAVVYSGTKPVAAGFLAGFRDGLEIPWASSLRSFNKFSPNMLLYWTCLEFACHQGYRFFDFGRSTAGGNTYRFKQQWGANPHPLYWYYWLPNGVALPEVNPTNPKYRAAIAIWQRLPLGVSRALGPRIIKYVP